MKVKEFVDVVNYQVLDYAKIYMLRYNKDFKNYDYVFTGTRVKSKKDLEPYYDCELSSFELIAPYGEYDDSAIYIRMPIKVRAKCTEKILQNGELITVFTEGNIYYACESTFGWGFIVTGELGQGHIYCDDAFNKHFVVIDVDKEDSK